MLSRDVGSGLARPQRCARAGGHMAVRLCVRARQTVFAAQSCRRRSSPAHRSDEGEHALSTQCTEERAHLLTTQGTKKSVRTLRAHCTARERAVPSRHMRHACMSPQSAHRHESRRVSRARQWQCLSLPSHTPAPEALSVPMRRRGPPVPVLCAVQEVTPRPPGWQPPPQRGSRAGSRRARGSGPPHGHCSGRMENTSAASPGPAPPPRASATRCAPRQSINATSHLRPLHRRTCLQTGAPQPPLTASASRECL